MTALTTLRLEHGTLEVIGFYRTDLGGIVRSEYWRGDDGTTSYEHSHAKDKDDMTPPHSPSRDGYNSCCGWCYLNAPHTKAAHEERLKP